MKNTILEYYRVALIALVATVLVSPVLFVWAAYGTLLYKAIRWVVLWLY